MVQLKSHPPGSAYAAHHFQFAHHNLHIRSKLRTAACFVNEHRCEVGYHPSFASAEVGALW